MGTPFFRLWSSLLFLLILTVALAPAQAKKEKTAGEEKKNVLVLKDLPASQFSDVMDLVGASLGVRCNFCHVNDSTGWHYDLDDKKEKKTARKMMQMVLDLNKNNFGGNDAISCYTCHRGSTEPVRKVALPVMPSRPRGEENKSASALPAVDQLISGYEQALGGEAAMKKITSRVVKGSAVDLMGHEMPQEIVLKAPDKYISTITFREGMQRSQCYNAGKAWISSPRGVHELPPDEAEMLKGETAFFPLAELKKASATAHVKGRDTVNGQAAYVLSAPGDDGETNLYYIDSASGLLVRQASFLETPIGVIPHQVDYADYRTVDGVKVPFGIRTSALDPRDGTNLKVTSLEQNVPIDDKQFAPPEKKK